MASESEDALGELYAWDSTIDEMYELGEDHADFDEDEALEAYEEIIGAGARDEWSDAALTLAAQLLTKHFYKFRHVNLNVVDVLLGLCDARRPVPVRINTARALLQVVKSATRVEPPLAPACRERLSDRVRELLASESSSVVQRNLAYVQDALAAADEAIRSASAETPSKSKKKDAVKKTVEKAASNKDQPLQQADKTKRDAKDDEERRREAAKREKREERFATKASTPTNSRETESTKKRESEPTQKRGDAEPTSMRESEPVKKQRESRFESAADRNERRKSDAARDRPQPAPEPPRDDAARGGDRRNGGSTKDDNGCPPSPFIFMGGVPRNTTHDEIIKYLSCIDESITYPCVQIKFPPSVSRNAAGYAFVSLESTDHARKAIRHIATTEFNGRNLIGDFARGPPCSTLQFVERNGSRPMREADSVHAVDLAALDNGVWDQLCDALKPFGSLEVLRDGRVRFRDTESAKSVVRKHHFNVQGHEFLPVYDPEEQAEIDSSRRGRRNSRGDDYGDNGRGSLSKYGGASDRGDRDRRDSRDRNDHGDRKRRRSSSFDRDQRDKAPRRDHMAERTDRRWNNPDHREFDQARYGPRDAPAERPASMKRDQYVHRGNGSHRSRSRSPMKRDHVQARGENQHESRRPRSRSPGRRGSDGGDKGKRERSRRSRSRSSTKPASPDQNGRGVTDRRGFDHPSSRDKPRDRQRERFAEPIKSSSPQQFDRPRSPARRGSRESRQDEKKRSRSPTSRSDTSDSKRVRDGFNRDKPEVSRGRSQSPRRGSPAQDQFNGRHHENETRGRADAQRERGRSRSPAHNDRPNGDRRDHTKERRKSDIRSSPELSRDNDDRQPARQYGKRHDSQPPPMSKYGTTADAKRSPSPTNFRNDELPSRARSRSRDHADRPTRNDDRDRTDQSGEGRGRGRFAVSTENRPHNGNDKNYRGGEGGRRASPPRERHGDWKDKSAPHRGRSPPSKRDNAKQDRSGHAGARSRSRSPTAPLSGQKRHRSRSPGPNNDIGRDNRRSRGDFDTKRQGGGRDDRQERPSDDRKRTDTATRDSRPQEGSRERGRGREKVDSPRKASRRDAERRPRSPSPQVSRESPVSSRDHNVDDVKPQNDSPRVVFKTSASSAYEDIDECMVDYEEDDE